MKIATSRGDALFRLIMPITFSTVLQYVSFSVNSLRYRNSSCSVDTSAVLTHPLLLLSGIPSRFARFTLESGRPEVVLKAVSSLSARSTAFSR